MPDAKLSIEGGAGCEKESWSPEVYSLFGDPETIISKLDDIDMRLPSRRVYIFTLETKDRAELSFYERSSGENVEILHWTGAPDPTLRPRIARAIIDNRGVHCVGEQSKAIVTQLSGVQSRGEVPSPANARAAFSHAIRAQADSYAEATVYLMC